ncbi:bifunctional PLP-dependent enzyme with beta-cystathionase and maltose regulon repressor activities [Longilinea arvoryzae]|uniref:cysteine-S-conjugate beta-lyase n=1 Tax=Longilinea arvoryzae TaxID=360412 RepID=A0A0S7BKK8_9CHLR|nr:PatB family C-S lyase [Longilinea arvoryzae]GAP15171.1 bifunctional PLP-dependent enzyme with beta-cystathionase and maltose regulon repressor activities [Longilinea arvoryzae]
MDPRFDILPDRKNTNSVKWSVYKPDVLPMWVADMDFRSPEAVLRALQKEVDLGVFGYPDGSDELKDVIVKRMAELYHWVIRPEDVVLISGVVTGLNMVAHLFSKVGGEALVQIPIYPPFLSAPGNAGLSRVDVEMIHQPDGSYDIDFEAFEAAITDRTRVFMLCNPHNPVGRVYRRDELERLAEICLRHNILICSDEIHCDLIFSGYHHVPIATLQPEIAHNTITLMAPSKTYNIPGLECSFAVIPNPELRERFEKAGEGMNSWVNLMGLVAGKAAYQDGQDWLSDLMKYLEGNRDFLFDFVNQHLSGVRMAKPEGTYLGWLDCNDAGIQGSPYEFFLQNAKVALNDGKAFGRGAEGFVRLNFGCPRSMLEDALQRMKQALEQLKQPVQS